MDTVTLVDNQIDGGEKLLDQLDEKGVVVRAASWVKPVEEDRWSLYIATPAVDEQGITAAYRQVLQVLRSLGKVWITPSDIMLVGEKHPLARDVLDILRRFPTGGKPPSSPGALGGISVDEVFVYPQGKRLHLTIYGLQLFPGEPSGGLHLSLEPHNPPGTLTVGKGPGRKEYLPKIGIDWEVVTPAGATLERNEIGQKVLAWDLHGNRIQSSANEVWSLAKLGLHGFRFLRQPA